MAIRVPWRAIRHSCTVIFRIGKQNFPFDEAVDHLKLGLKIGDMFLQIRRDNFRPFFMILRGCEQRSHNLSEFNSRIFKDVKGSYIVDINL